ncbi:MAG: hypothetical protein LBI82_11410 [Dysgonamonadaceae bacterium]|jgi:hypothetical protein|nr:hypothetical protein [Dysgonamonadaceae bacterium]
MFLILLTWVYMFFIFSVQGECINRWLFKGKLNSIGGTSLTGIVFQTILVTIVAFFYRINIEYFYVNTFLTIILFFLYRKTWLNRVKSISKWDWFCKILFFVILCLSLMRSSMLPFLLDNESYYIQTIKWLNEYGWVKGLANLHIFLIHGSPWHALQAAYNFNFIAGLFNDINGFLLCVVSLLWIDKIFHARKNADYQTSRWLFFLPVFLVLWFQFIDSPSVDLPLYLISLVVIYCVLNRSNTTDLCAILLAVFLVFIKASIAPILIIAIFLLNKKNWKISLFFAFMLGAIYIFKGIWLSGCPLAPYTGLRIPLPWVIFEGASPVIATDSFDYRSFISKGWVNAILLSAIVIVVLIYGVLSFRKKEQLPVFFFIIAELLLVFLTFTQIRYMLPVLFYPAAYLLSKIKFTPRMLFVIIYTSIFTVIIPMIIDLDIGRLSKSSKFIEIDVFHVQNVLVPAGITNRPDLTFEVLPCRNFEFYNPSDTSNFIFLTGDGPLPCVPTKYLQYMYDKTGCLPALIGEEPGEGFKHVEVQEFN